MRICTINDAKTNTKEIYDANFIGGECVVTLLESGQVIGKIPYECQFRPVAGLDVLDMDKLTGIAMKIIEDYETKEALRP